MPKFEETADMPAQGIDAGEAPDVEPPQEDGQLPTVYEESEADLEAHIMALWCAELQDERELPEATPIDELYTAPTERIADISALVTVAEEQRGHLPKWGNPLDTYTTETYH
eukprot:5746836-Pyramimonas_sp.AAC.1